MRNFSDLEKKCIKLWIESPLGERHIVKALEPYLTKEIISIEFESKIAKIANNKNDRDLSPEEFDAFMGEMVKRRNEITEKIIMVAKLIEYLEIQGLITTYRLERYRISNTDTFGLGKSYNLSHFSPFSDSIVGELLSKYTLTEIIPSKDLEQLSLNNFVIPSDIKFIKSERRSWAAISIAILVPFVSLVWGQFTEREDQFIKAAVERKFDKISKEINVIEVKQTKIEKNVYQKIEDKKRMFIRIDNMEKMQNKTIKNMARIEQLDRRLSKIEKEK